MNPSMQSVFRRACGALFICAFATCAFAQAPAPAWPAAEWERATPEEMGMDSAALATFVEFGANTRMDSLVVTRWGRIVAEAYYAPFQRGMKHRINSSTKAVMGALAGIAAGQGRLDVNAPALGFFKGATAANEDDRKRAITVQQLLNMTSGISWVEPLSDEVPETMIAMGRSANWVQFVLDRPMAQAPGAKFNYNSGDWQLVSAIVSLASGMPSRDFAAKHLLAPLGIVDWRWRLDPQGVATGGFGLYLRTQDMARFGYLYLHHGQWNGTQVVPRAWADKVFQASVPMFATGAWKYADGWWTLPSRGAYFTVGFDRQLIVVMPETGVVAAMTGRSNYPLDNVIDHLARAARSASPLPADAQGQAALDAKIREAATPKPMATLPAAPPIAREVAGRTYALERNPWGMKEMTLRMDGAPAMELVVYTSRTSNATMKVTLPLGMDGKFTMSETPEGLTAIQAGWTDASTLSAVLRVPEEGISRTYELRFDGARVAVTVTNSTGAKTSFSGEAR
ncbi:serine hydrolase domain-containing protein [Caenimonas aquaedulcis]|uniref:Serine hydrolase n=1 Tax=Caenimonas aquaedulcis TaxID=2793270 RepID=A0A931MH93_9BURK|nr:serine hydrolase [Caenimonas aquaedulcis]MBG9388653.1 serine hydrolase [Caenimonas aquaedulcis]